MHLFATTTPQQALQLGKAAGVVEVEPPPIADVPVVLRKSVPQAAPGR